MKPLPVLFTTCWLVAVLTGALSAQNLDADLQRAKQREATSGDCKSVLTDYERIVEQGAKSNRAAAAEALLRTGLCHESLGDGRAQPLFERLLRDYADTTFAAVARGKLDGGGRGANARQLPENAFVSRVLSQGADSRALVSPDGRFVALTTGPARNQHLVIRETATNQSKPVQATAGDYAGKAWAPDSSRLAFQFRQAGANGWEVQTVDPRTGKRESLQVASSGSIRQVAWSPGSDELAISPSGPTSDADEVSVLNLATGKTRTVTRGRLRPFSVDTVSAWTSDNHLVVWRRPANGGTEWFLVPAGGGTERRICVETPQTSGGTDVCRTVAPDGRTQIVVKNDSNRILLRDLATGADRRLTVGTGEERFLMLSPDGRLVAFEANHEGKWGIWVAPVASAPVEPLRLGSLDRAAYMPMEGGELWTRDGALTLGFYFEDIDIYRVDVNAGSGRAVGSLRRLTQDAPKNRAPVVSPDSRQIAFWSATAQRGGLALMDATGANERVIVRRDADFWSRAVWKSAGELLIPQPASVPTDKGVDLVDVATGASSPLADSRLERVDCDPAARNFAFARASSELYYLTCSRWDRTGVILRARSLSGGRDRDVVEIDYPTGFAISADGRKVAYSRRTSASGTPVGRELWVIDANGENKRLVFSATTRAFNVTPFSFSPDGKYLLFQMEPRPGAAGSVYVINSATGESWPLIANHPGIDRLDEASWSPDGSFIVLTGQSERYDWRQWEGVTYDAVMKLMAKGGGR